MRRITMIRFISMLLCLVLQISFTASCEEDTATRYRISTAQYPSIPRNPDLDIPEEIMAYSYLVDEYTESEAFTEAWRAWNNANNKRRTLTIPNMDALDSFVQTSARAMLSEEDGQNNIYSPVNLWYAICILSELSGGDCRAQLMNALGLKTEDELLAQAEAMSLSGYWDDGASVSIPGASLWMNPEIQLSPELLEKLARYCYTDVFQGKFGDAQLNEALHMWLNARTNGLLSDVVGSIELQENMPFALFTTMYMRAKWSDEFYTSGTFDQVFHAPEGDIECPFMHEYRYGNVYVGKRFTAVLRGMRGGETVYFLLPNEGISPETLLEDEDVFRFWKGPEEREILKSCYVNLSMPKLDCKCDMSFRDGMERMGIMDIFRNEGFELSQEVQAQMPVYGNDMKQSGRLIMDEEGIEAASILSYQPLYGALSEEEIDFTLDRPFLMIIVGDNDVPTFIGVINNPTYGNT